MSASWSATNSTSVSPKSSFRSRRTIGSRRSPPTAPPERDHAVVCEVTDKVDLSAWPDGTRMIARREPCHPGAQLTFTDEEGHRFQVCVTDLADTDISYLEALYRGRGRVEQTIADAKDTGLANLPSGSATCARGSGSAWASPSASSPTIPAERIEVITNSGTPPDQR
jgi:hypothetical protein